MDEAAVDDSEIEVISEDCDVGTAAQEKSSRVDNANKTNRLFFIGNIVVRFPLEENGLL